MTFLDYSRNMNGQKTIPGCELLILAINQIRQIVMIREFGIKMGFDKTEKFVMNRFNFSTCLVSLNSNCIVLTYLSNLLSNYYLNCHKMKVDHFFIGNFWRCVLIRRVSGFGLLFIFILSVSILSPIQQLASAATPTLTPAIMPAGQIGPQTYPDGLIH